MDDWLGITEAAETLGVTAGTLRRWDRSGKLRATRHPHTGHRLYARQDLALVGGVDPAPLPPDALLGRTDEQDALREAIRQPGLVTVLGPPGIGKTCLARAVVHAHGGLHVDCATVDTVGALGPAVAVAVGRPGLGTDLAHLWSRLRRVILLDEVEHLVDHGLAEELRCWLDTAPGLRLVATSRRAIGLRHERRIALGALPAEAARAWFERCATSSWPASELDPLLERLDGNPLALELAAPLCDLLGPVPLLHRLTPQLLVTDRVDVPPRHRSLDAAVRASLALLPPDTVAALHELRVFRGGFELAGAEAVLGDRALEHLQVLTSHSLLQRRADGGSVRHHPWTLLTEVLSASPVPAGAVERHARWLGALGRTLAREESRLLAEVPNALAALENPDVSAGARAAVLEVAFFRRRIPASALLTWLTELLEDPSLPPSAARSLRRHRVTTRLMLADFDGARADLDLLQGGLQDGAMAEVADLLHLRATLLQRLSDPAGLEQVLARAEAVLARAHDAAPDTEVGLRYLRAQLLLRRGDTEHGLRALQEVVRRTAGASADVELTARAALLVARTSAGHPTELEALDLLHRARTLGHTGLEVVALHVLAVAEQQLGRLARAEDTFGQAIELARLTGRHEREAVSWLSLASARLERGDTSGSRAAADQTLLRLAGAPSPLAERAEALIALASVVEAPDSPSSDRTPPACEVARGILAVVARLQGHRVDHAPPAHREPLYRAVSRIEARASGGAVAQDGSWFRGGGGERVELRGRPALRGVLAALQEAAALGCSIEALQEAGWPGERMGRVSAVRRVRTAIWTLRRLGLGDRIETRPGAYALRP